MKRIKFTKAPTFTKAMIGAALFAIVYLATTSNLPSCSDTTAVLSGNGECIERQSFLHTGSGWLAIICVIAAVALLALKHKDSILGRPTPAGREQGEHAQHGPSAPAYTPAQPTYQPTYQQAAAARRAPAPGYRPASAAAPARMSNFCPKCGTRIIAGDRFCQGCGIPMGGNESGRSPEGSL
jgi:hypothetical protein